MYDRSHRARKTIGTSVLAPALIVLAALITTPTASAQTPKQDKAAAAGVAQPAQDRSGVRINRVELDSQTVQALGQQFGIQVTPGDYWYDPFSGLFGLMGGPGLGFTMPGLEVGGPLPLDASGGDTNVFVNGRELHALDVAALMALVGGDGQSSYFFDPNSGCSVISGGGVSC